ncbi:hypothetical protein [Actinoalloteichus caeruleus]|uniref:hypothetical protein n=1 Tax=Actinoalloteichus cyanogriseus TaxID=2893586 RepID=UPI000689508A|nr:hypothetical protein [Actinoalloteichus caeruleus]
MVGDLIRLKLTLLRRSLSGQRAAQLVLGALVGLLAAVGTIWIAGITAPVASVSGDLLGAALAVWFFGWAFGPILFGSGGTELRPDQLSLFPIRPRVLTVGLVSAGAVGVGPIVTLVALVALVVHGAGSGVVPALVAVPGLLLTLVLVVLVSKVIVTGRGQVVRSQLGAALSGLFTGVLMAAGGTVWAIAPALGNAFTSGFPAGFSVTVHALPSGWALTAVDAAGRGDWALVMAGLGGLLVADLLLVAALASLLGRQLTSGRAQGRRTRRVTPSKPGPLDRWTGRVPGVAAKELRTWFRDVTRTNFLYFALFYGLLQTVTPLVIGADVLLPWTGVIVAVWVAAVSANMYASDGTALWLTMVTPRGERADVRGRQLAWLVIVAPIALVLTVVFTAVSGLSWAWPWALALTASVLGAGAGAVVLVAVLFPVPMTDPRQRGSGAWDNRIDFVQVLAVLGLMALSTLPTFGTLWIASAVDSSALSWLAVLVGVGTGALYTWGLGGLAHRRLAGGGAGLLQLMRSGHRIATARPAAPASGQSPADGRPQASGAGWPTVALVACFVLCWIPLLPQGVVPMILKLVGSDARSWFLALWMPDHLQWPVIIGMMVLGLGILATGFVIAAKYDIRPPSRRGGTPGLGAQVRSDLEEQQRRMRSGV